MDSFYKDIPEAATWVSVEPVHKGWSKDKKYYIKTISGSELLLRTSDISQYDQKKREYEAILRLVDQDILMSRPLQFGVCNGGQSVYSLLTWIDGEDAEKIIPTLSVEEQYQLGVKAGQYLQSIHQMPAGKDQVPWADYYNRKIDKYITNYKACGIVLKGEDQVIQFIEANRYLLDGRPQTFQHGDYHVGNMIVTKSGDLGIIDFNRFDDGDPWEEFNRITFCAMISAEFASGRIHGYFNNNVPDLFFKMMALYIASNQLSSIYWAIPFGKEDVADMLSRAESVLKWYDDFQTYIPNWYLASK
ncbi:aminoglycoside phosphotransferase [Paenibacillus sp. FSL R5-0345]|uniref:aminoglycoside phosphotransferase family protein n=1 Tax=unclassified Paenibacillus TaxID=185978 RepID=UPI0004F800E0|nr:phosphotransferase family protein [Paenibacillus sp. FSL R5-0345]AIQ36717.1 aminoglycoside phosphotransferase [Paenibacillus sp. FSL R5-0345]